MNFEEIQKTWQTQPAPDAPLGKANASPNVLDQVKKLHRKVLLSNIIMSVCLAATAIFLGWMWLNLPQNNYWLHLGMSLIFLDMFLIVPLVWLRSMPWGNQRPDLSSREYLAAALKSFRFRQTSQRVIMPIYAVVLFIGIHLAHHGIFMDRPLKDRLFVHAADTAFMLFLAVFTFYRQRHVYRKKYAPVVKELEAIERELNHG